MKATLDEVFATRGIANGGAQSVEKVRPEVEGVLEVEKRDNRTGGVVAEHLFRVTEKVRKEGVEVVAEFVPG